MVGSVQSAVVCRRLIGRDVYLRDLDGILDAAARGHGRVVAISGEPGIGKSRMIAEVGAVARARALPFDVAQGNCFEFDAATPFAPLIDLVRSCMASRSEDVVQACIAPDAPVLAHILPELGTLLQGSEPVLDRGPEFEKRLIFTALSNVFSRVSAQNPLLLVVEDMHWSDEATLEFLGQFARNIVNLPVVLVIDYRADEVGTSLRRLLASFDRQRIVTDWPLGRLTPNEVSEMLVAMFDLTSPPSQAAVARMHALTEGNPFFIEEVLKSSVMAGGPSAAADLESLAEAGATVPRSVHAAVQERMERLTRETRHIAELAAIAGRRFDFALLQRLAGVSEDGLLDAIKELIDCQIVAEESADHFAFRHALTQQAIYGDLLARERRSLHLQVAQALQELHADAIEEHVSELAHHFWLAEAWDESYFYCRRAGEKALAVDAPGAAAEHLERARDAAARLGVRPPAALHRHSGQALDALGDFAGARRELEQALETGKAQNDGAGEWQALVDLGLLWAGRDYERSGHYYERAQQLAETLGDAALRAASLNRSGNWLANVGRPAEGIDCHRRALMIYEEMNDGRGRADTLDLLGMCYGLQGNCPASVGSYREAVVSWRRIGNRARLASALASLATWASPAIAESTHVPCVRPDEMLDAANEAVRLARETGALPLESFVSFAAGETYIGFGRLGEGIELARKALVLAEEAGHAQWTVAGHFTLGQAFTFARDTHAAIEHLEAAWPIARELGSAWWIGDVCSQQARAHVLDRDAGRARAVLERAWPEDQEPQNHGQRRVAVAWAELALLEGRAADALTQIDSLLQSAPGAPEGAVMPFMRHIRADALAALGRQDEALAAMEDARADAEAAEAPLFLWPILRSLGRLHAAQRRPLEAAQAFAAVRDVVERVAAEIDNTQIRDTFLRGALETLPRERPPTANQAAKAAFGGLTTREREVATLVARGRSNREIADELVLGERTIETHVGHVLSKLGFNSRAQIAAWAVESGLTGRGTAPQA